MARLALAVPLFPPSVAFHFVLASSQVKLALCYKPESRGFEIR
jgi:hypothetical protein